MQYHFKYNDQVIRLIGIPAFGILIPTLTGLNSYLNHPGFLLGLVSSVVFIFLSFLIWQGNKYFLLKVESKVSWLKNPARRIGTLLLFNALYTTGITILFLSGWFWLFVHQIYWYVILEISLINLICVVFVTHSYETVLLYSKWTTERMYREKTEKLKMQSELDALKNQVDPHFMFNSLNTLNYLIRLDSKKALSFVEALAEVYRYILDQKKEDLVLLEQEITFIEHFLHLLKLRFEDAIKIQFKFDVNLTNRYLVTSNSLLVPIENAVKHNEVSYKTPLVLLAEIIENQLIISNEIHPRKSPEISTKLGLKNLAERVKLSTGKTLGIDRINGNFQITIPLIKLTS